MKKAFWIVWSYESGATIHKHASKEEALKEAERLAAKHPDKPFHVLQAISTSQTRIIETEYHIA
ncbi:hypothetical protein KAR91_05725 [Candidatus Pacearchaeota archaeon]|nr:hypothetical protein [Candidatus Pacearchaeota archaeon]